MASIEGNSGWDDNAVGDDKTEMVAKLLTVMILVTAEVVLIRLSGIDNNFF